MSIVKWYRGTSQNVSPLLCLSVGTLNNYTKTNKQLVWNMIFIDLNILNNILLRNNIKVKLMYVVIQKNKKLKKR